MSNATNPVTLETAVKAVAGEHFPAIMEEFVDLNNDFRCASTREVMDLGIPRLVAEKCLFIVREAYVGKPVETALAEA
jgi:hypothetical protein